MRNDDKFKVTIEQLLTREMELDDLRKTKESLDERSKDKSIRLSYPPFDPFTVVHLPSEEVQYEYPKNEQKTPKEIFYFINVVRLQFLKPETIALLIIGLITNLPSWLTYFKV